RSAHPGRCRAGAVAEALLMTEVTGCADWDGDIGEARALQVELAAQALLRDGFHRPLRTIAGFNVGFDDDGATTRAAAVLLDADGGQVLASEVARIPTRMPCIPGLLSFRELPAL